MCVCVHMCSTDCISSTCGYKWTPANPQNTERAKKRNCWERKNSHGWNKFWNTPLMLVDLGPFYTGFADKKFSKPLPLQFILSPSTYSFVWPRVNIRARGQFKLFSWSANKNSAVTQGSYWLIMFENSSWIYLFPVVNFCSATTCTQWHIMSNLLNLDFSSRDCGNSLLISSSDTLFPFCFWIVTRQPIDFIHKNYPAFKSQSVIWSESDPSRTTVSRVQSDIFSVSMWLGQSQLSLHESSRHNKLHALHALNSSNLYSKWNSN